MSKLLMTNYWWHTDPRGDGKEDISDYAARQVFERLRATDPGTRDIKDVQDEFVWNLLYQRYEIAFREFEHDLEELLADCDAPVIIHGGIGRWDGTRSGFDPIRSVRDVHDFLKDCEYVTLELTDGGDLFLDGIHHDGHSSGTFRYLTKEGREWVDKVEYGEEHGPFDYEKMTRPLDWDDRFGDELMDFDVDVEPWFVREANSWRTADCWSELRKEDVTPDYAALMDMAARSVSAAAGNSGAELSVSGFAETDMHDDVLMMAVTADTGRHPDAWEDRVFHALSDAFTLLDASWLVGLQHVRLDRDSRILYMILTLVQKDAG